jgi:hypothetical protein
MRKALIENIIKNIVIVGLLITCYFPAKDFLLSSELATNKGLAGDLLVAISILIVTASFGNFAFTYDKTKMEKFSSRILSHITTGLLMFLIGLSIEMSAILSGILVGNFFILNIAWVTLYLASVSYDFWDFERAG